LVIIPTPSLTLVRELSEGDWSLRGAGLRAAIIFIFTNQRLMLIPMELRWAALLS
jgi:hypothetical protein